MRALIFTLLATFSLGIWAHEGHDKNPGAISAPHGGQVRGTAELYLELVADRSGFKLYPLTHEMQPIALKDVQLEGSIRLPKKPKAENLKLNANGDFFEGKVDAKGAHRYTVEMKVTYKGKTEKVKFNVEPK